MHAVERLAGDATPVGLSVLHRGDSSARVGARDGPTGLGDPDPLAGRDGVDSVAGGGDGVPEGVRGIADSGVLEVGVAVRNTH